MRVRELAGRGARVGVGELADRPAENHPLGRGDRRLRNDGDQGRWSITAWLEAIATAPLAVFVIVTVTG